MDSVADASFLDKIANDCRVGELEDDEDQEDDARRQEEMLAMLAQELPDDLLDDSYSDASNDMDDHNNTADESENSNSNLSRGNIDDADEHSHIKLINGQEFRPNPNLYEVPSNKVPGVRYDTNELLEFAAGNDQRRQSIEAPGYVNHNCPNSKNSPGNAKANSEMPHPRVDPIKPTNFSTISGITDNQDDVDDFDNQQAVVGHQHPSDEYQNNPSSFCPPQASTAIGSSHFRTHTPPSNGNPQHYGERLPRERGQVVENQGGSYLSSTNSNSNSWSFEVFGKNNHGSPHSSPTQQRSPAKYQSLPTSREPVGFNGNMHLQHLNPGDNVPSQGLYSNVMAAEEFGSGDLPYKVVYRPKMSANQLTHSMDANNITPPRSNRRMFMETGGVTMEQQLSQLNILYEARGKRINELQSQIDASSNESLKQIRILQHQLNIMENNSDGLKLSLDASLATQSELKQQIEQLQVTIRSRDNQIEALSAAKIQAEQKVQVLERTISSLNSQMEDMCRSDVMSRSREQHETAVRSLTQKYQSEMFSLNQQITQLQTSLEEKDLEVKKVGAQLKEVEDGRSHEKVRQAEVVNKLTQSLEQSQKQCRDLLNTNSSVEYANLQAQLKQVSMSKNMSEQIGKMLQDEVNDLRTQLAEFEAVSSLNLGIFPGKESSAKAIDTSVDAHDESVLNATTAGGLDEANGENGSDSDYVQRLKNELEKCLINNLSKRNRIDKLNKELESCRQMLTAQKSDFTVLEKEKRDLEFRNVLLQQQSASNMMTSSDGAIPKGAVTDEGSAEKVRQELQKEIDVLTQKLHEESERCASLEKNLQDSSSKLKRFESDKKEAVERTRSTCLKMHEDAQENLRKELERVASQEKEQLVQYYQDEIGHLKESVKQATDEADYVKSCFVKLSEETKLAEQNRTSPMKSSADMYEIFTQTDNDEYEEALEKISSLEAEIQDRAATENNLNEEVSSWKEQTKQVEQKMKEQDEFYAEKLTTLQKDFNEVQIQLKAAEEMLRREQAKSTQISNSNPVTTSTKLAAEDERLKSAQAEVAKLEKERDELKQTIEELKESSVNEMEALESVYQKTTEELKKLLNEEASTRSKLENDCASLQSTVEELNVQIDKVTSARDKTLKKMENEKKELLARLEKDKKSLEDELARSQEALKTVEQNLTSQMKEAVQKVQNELSQKEQQHKTTVAELHKKQQNSAKSESKLRLELKHLKEQQVGESSQAIMMMDKKIAEIQHRLESKDKEAAASQENSRKNSVVCAEKETQTDSDYCNPSSLADFKSSVLDTINMMKVDVVDYVLNRQEQICAILRDEMHKDQQIMSQHMQENYLSSLNHILVNELLPKVQQDMQVTSDIRNLVSNLSENMTPATAGSINGSSSQSSGGSTIDDPNDVPPLPHNDPNLAHHVEGDNHSPHVGQIAIDLSHERTSVHGMGSGGPVAPFSNDERFRRDRNGVGSQATNYNKPNFSRSTPTSPHSLTRQHRTTALGSNGSAIKRDKVVSKRQLSRDSYDVKRRSGEIENAPLSDNQQHNILMTDNLLNSSAMNLSNSTIDIPHRLFHQMYPSGDENPRVPNMSTTGVPYHENGYRNGSNSLPRKLNHHSTSNGGGPVVMNVYSDYVSHGHPTSLQQSQAVVTNSRGGQIVGSVSGSNHLIGGGVTSSTPRDSVNPMTSSYNPIYPSQMQHQSSNPYLRNFQSYPAFQAPFNGSSSNASDISTDTYANLPKSFSLFRSKNFSRGVSADPVSAFNQSASSALPTSSSALRYSQSALAKSSYSSGAGGGPTKQF